MKRGSLVFFASFTASRAIPALALVCLFTGCALTPRPSTPDATAALIARKDFPAAAQAAPQWVDAALRTITAYEAQLAAKP